CNERRWPGDGRRRAARTSIPAIHQARRPLSPSGKSTGGNEPSPVGETWMMSGDLTRRHLLTLAGASAAAAFGSAGCTSDCADQRPCPPAEAAQVYVSRPDLTPPAVTLARYPGAEDSRLIFLDVPYSGPGHGGTLILDSGGE